MNMNNPAVSDGVCVKVIENNTTAPRLEASDIRVEGCDIENKQNTTLKVPKVADLVDLSCKQIQNDSSINLTVSSNENSADSVFLNKKRNRKQITTVRANSDNNNGEVGEVNIKNVCKKPVKNNLLNIISADSSKLKKFTELTNESTKTKENTNILEKLNTFIENEEEILKSHSITPTEYSVISERFVEQQKLETDDFETIDKIADMIANTDNNEKLSNESNQTGQNSSDNNMNDITKKLAHTKNCAEPCHKPSFEEVETKLEKMFAGIEDEIVSDAIKPPSYCKNNKIFPKEDCPSSKDIVFHMAPNENVFQNETIAQKRICSSKNYPSKKKRKMIKKSFDQKTNKLVENKQKSKNVKEEIIPTDKYKGPFIQLNSEGVIKVVNTPLTEEDSEKRTNIKKLVLNYTKREKNKIMGLHVSTLSNKYDADTTDISWLCFFCKKGPHKKEHGDLFGPYIVNTSCEEFRISQNHLQNVLEIQRVRREMYQKDVNRFPIVPSILSKANKFRTENKQYKKASRDDSPPQKNTEIFAGMVKISDTSYEIWVHEDCIIWASGIYLIGSKIIGLESAVWRSTTNICSICSINGAIVCCLQRECQEISHIACAKSENWTISENDFKAYCRAHSEQARH